MVRTGTLLDTGMVYFDARLSEHYPTIELRIADVCLHGEDTVLLAGLARALVETEARAAREGKPAPPTRTELLRLAAWRASRSGLDEDLLNPVTGLPEQAATVVSLLVDHCRDALDEAGDTDAVTEMLSVPAGQRERSGVPARGVPSLRPPGRRGEQRRRCHRQRPLGRLTRPDAGWSCSRTSRRFSWL